LTVFSGFGLKDLGWREGGNGGWEWRCREFERDDKGTGGMDLGMIEKKLI
jgi:hypothetical protein